MNSLQFGEADNNVYAFRLQRNYDLTLEEENLMSYNYKNVKFRPCFQIMMTIHIWKAKSDVMSSPPLIMVGSKFTQLSTKKVFHFAQ